MSINRNIADELKQVKKDLKNIILKIESLEKMLSINDNNEIKDGNKNILLNPSLKKMFVDYLRLVVRLKEHTINSYLTDLKRARKLIIKYLTIELPYEIVEIGDYDLLKNIFDKLFLNEEFIEYNNKYHSHYTASLNNYLRFLVFNSNSFDFED